MERGWGLTVVNSCLSLSSDHNFNKRQQQHGQEIKNKIMFPVIDFPVSRSSSSRDDEQPPPHGGAQPTPSEVDFFSDKNRRLHGDGGGGVVVKKENSHDEVDSRPEIMDVNTGLNLLTANIGSDESTVDDENGSNVKRTNIELKQLQMELGLVIAENQKLKEMLSQVTNNYSALQMHLVTLMQQQQHNRASDSAEIVDGKSQEKKHEVSGSAVPRQFLNLGQNGIAETDELSNSSSGERTQSGSPQNHQDVASKRPRISTSSDDKGLAAREGSPGSETQGWMPNKVAKLNGNNSSKPVDQQSADASMRKVRVSVRARSEAPMISDGCQWRKYGQKMAKGNPCPRAYYRCTMAVGCPVRKQVQRCAEDRTILITTYEGTHNHPLPPAAMAMASTTSAAANMLLSGSMSSADGLMNPNILARAILPCSSMATISASAPFPTVTLDLTQNPNNTLQFQRQQPNSNPFNGHNFATAAENNALPQIFSQSKSKFSGLHLSQDTDLTQLAHRGQALPSFADTVSAATAAITADPNFTAALAAAIKSIIGGANNDNNNTQKR